MQNFTLDPPKDYFSIVRDEIIELIPTGVKAVLEIGCGYGATLEKIKEIFPEVEIFAVEKNRQAYLVASEKFDNVYNADFEIMNVEILPRNYFDLIIVADVLEHLVNPWEALKKLSKLLAENGKLIASIPNIRNLRVLAKIIFDKFEYEPSGILDKTHLRFFTLHTIRNMFETTGYEIEKVVHKKTRGWKADVIRFLSFYLLSPFLVEQFLVVAHTNKK